MFELNKNFLSKTCKEYDVESIAINDCDFLVYRLIGKKHNICVYLFLCKNFSISTDISVILEKISFWDQSFKNGSSYLCITPGDYNQIDMCTQFNGKSFVHFIFYDHKRDSLIYDKDFFYHGSKHLKQLIDIYLICFNQFYRKALRSGEKFRTEN